MAATRTSSPAQARRKQLKPGPVQGRHTSRSRRQRLKTARQGWSRLRRSVMSARTDPAPPPSSPPPAASCTPTSCSSQSEVTRKDEEPEADELTGNDAPGAAPRERVTPDPVHLVPPAKQVLARQ